MLSLRTTHRTGSQPNYASTHIAAMHGTAPRAVAGDIKLQHRHPRLDTSPEGTKETC